MGKQWHNKLDMIEKSKMKYLGCLFITHAGLLTSFFTTIIFVLNIVCPRQNEYTDFFIKTK